LNLCQQNLALPGFEQTPEPSSSWPVAGWLGRSVTEGSPHPPRRRTSPALSAPRCPRPRTRRYLPPSGRWARAPSFPTSATTSGPWSTSCLPLLKAASPGDLVEPAGRGRTVARGAVAAARSRGGPALHRGLGADVPCSTRQRHDGDGRWRAWSRPWCPATGTVSEVLTRLCKVLTPT
jgi:hypothetical protein